MKTAKFIPKSCTEWIDDKEVKHTPKFSGHIMLRVPNFFERQELKMVLMSAIIQDGTTDIEAIKMDKSKVNVLDLISKMACLVKMSVPYYESVEISNIKTGEIYKSFEDLSFDESAEPILQEVAQEIANGFALSKN